MVPERRANLRTACMLPIRMLPRGDRQPIETLTKNLSLGGLMCVSPVERPIGTPVHLDLTLGRSHVEVAIHSRVAWFVSIPKSEQFYVGLAFDTISETIVRQLSTYIKFCSKSA